MKIDEVTQVAGSKQVLAGDGLLEASLVQGRDLWRMYC